MDSRRTIARRLEAVADFADPTIELEQYLTPPELAAHVVHLAALQGDLTGESVVDLGTGTGVLAIGASLFDPSRVVGIDVDAGALDLARENECRVARGLEDDGMDRRTPIDWVRGDVRRLPLSLETPSSARADAPSGATVVSNPPFGAQRGSRHADRPFLEAASELARVSYTIHNEGSQEFVESFVADVGGTVTHAFRATFPVDHRFDFHTDERRELPVEVFRIEWSGAESR